MHNSIQCEFFLEYFDVDKIINKIIITEFKENKYFKNTIFLFSYADEVSVGDEVMALRNDNLIVAKVINISSLFMQGNKIISAVFVL